MLDAGLPPVPDFSMEKYSDFDVEKKYEYVEAIDYDSESTTRRYQIICITIFVLIAIWGVIFSAIALLQNRQSIGRPRGNNYHRPSRIEESKNNNDNARMSVKKIETPKVVQKSEKEKLIPYGESEDAGQPIFSEDNQYKSPYWTEMLHAAHKFRISREVVQSETAVNQTLLRQYFGRVNKMRNSCKLDDDVEPIAGGNVNIFHSLAFTIEEVEICDTEVVDLLIIVHSTSQNFHNRQIIRQSYAAVRNILDRSIRLLFVVGESRVGEISDLVNNESSIYRDIIQGNFIDAWRNTTRKFNLALWWIGYHCPQASYIVKVNDDTFVDTGHLLMLLPHLPPKNLLYCKTVSQQSPERDAKESKRYLSFSEFPNNVLPNYCQSFGFIFSNDVASAMLGCSLESAKVVSLDEIFFTGVLREQLLIDIEEAWPGHQIEILMPNMVDPILMSDYIVFGSTTPGIQQELWHKLWKNAVLAISSKL